MGGGPDGGYQHSPYKAEVTTIIPSTGGTHIDIGDVVEVTDTRIGLSTDWAYMSIPRHKILKLTELPEEE